MKKVMSYMAAAFMTLSVITACGSLGSLVSNASTIGSVAGKALKALLDKYINLGNLGSLGNLGNIGNSFDLSDPATIDALTKIAKSVQSLKGPQTDDFLSKFAQGLIKGSNNAISQQSATAITNALVQLAQKQNLASALSDNGASQQAALKSMAGPVGDILKMIK
ncbi:MAG: hypothetical protein J6T09_07715 [Bacteroidales bacterium]|nr:hypothetical protein [Bacteroidales bacterium]